MDRFPKGSVLVLTDMSISMTTTIWGKYSSFTGVIAQSFDIQEIPFPEDSFDFSVTNHMLYHVPEAVSEVCRILRPTGKFCVATNGAGGMMLYLRNALHNFNPGINAFNEDLSSMLQNGKAVLCEAFYDITLEEYRDSLNIT